MRDTLDPDGREGQHDSLEITILHHPSKVDTVGNAAVGDKSRKPELFTRLRFPPEPEPSAANSGQGEQDGAAGSPIQPAAAAIGKSAWVPAISLWRQRFGTYKQAAKFLNEHPDMTRSPSKYRREIHAGLWATYWAGRDKRAAERLGEPPSIADDPEATSELLEGVIERAKTLRVKNKAGKHET
jgi:hypothetical protein